MSTAKTLISLFASLVVAAAVQAAPVIDQNSPTYNAHMAGFAQTNLAQSFKQTASDISGAGILLRAGVGSSDNVTISLYDKLPTDGGQLLASGSAIGTAGSWVDVFWADVAISANTTYFLVFSGNSTLGISGNTANPYSDGQVYANQGYQSFPGFDYTFRTYSDDGADNGHVPEPASLALVSGALMGAGFAARKRKQAK